MASERAKALKAEQKAAKQAAKERRKNSDNPRDWGAVRQIREAYKLGSEFDKTLKWKLLGAIVAPTLLMVLLVILVKPGIWSVSLILLGLVGGMALAAWLLVRAVKTGTYQRFAGQAGSGEVALGMLDKKWFTTPAIAANKHKDVVHRALGPGGLILIGEGERGRLKQLLASEKRKHEQVAYGVEVITIIMGEREGEIPLDQLAKHIKKLPKTLRTDQITEAKGRLKALDHIRPKMPIPHGPMPTSQRSAAKGMRQSMRGR